MSNTNNRVSEFVTPLPPEKQSQQVEGGHRGPSSAGRAQQGNLRTRLALSFVLAAVLPLLITAVIVTYLSYSVQIPLALETQSQIAKRVSEQVKSFITQREQELLSLVNVGDLEKLSPEQQTEQLSNLLSAQNLYDELVLLDETGQEIIYLSRLDVITSVEFSSRVGQVEFERPKATGKTYFSKVQFNKVNGQPFQIISIPVYNLRTGRLAYVLIANFRFNTVWDLMAQADVVGSGTVYMVDDTNQVIAHANPSIALQQKRVSLPGGNAFTKGLDGENVALAQEDIVLNEQTFSVVAEQPRSEALALANNNLLITVLISLLAIAGAIVFGSFVARPIINPIGELATSAEELTAGNLSVQVEIDRNDEIGALAMAFNSMASQLRSLIGSLEQRVEERTQELEGRTEQLEAIANLARSIATIQEADELLREITKQVSERFGFYHVGIFLLDTNRQFAILRAANSEGGQRMLARGHRLAVGQQGIVGFVTSQGKARIALNVGEEAVYFNNPDLPETQSEVALPLRFGQEIIGALDIQSTEKNAFSQKDVELFSILTDQLSVAIQNARSLEQAQRALREADRATVQLTGQGWEVFAKEMEVRGFRYDGSGSQPINNIATHSEDGVLKIPIQVRGQQIANLLLEPSGPDYQWPEDEIDLIQATAERAALALENARLLEDAQRRAIRERVIGDISASISTFSDMEGVLRTAVQQLGRRLGGAEVELELGADIEEDVERA